MTDKQIIDNVDVSGCEFFDECEVKLDWSDCHAHCSPYPEGVCYEDCSEHPNCYYKKLKRTEEVAKKHLAETFEMQKEIDQLKAENEKYKQLANSFENDFFNALSDKESNYVKNLKQALQEIKNFIYTEKAKVFVDMEDFWEQILQKCEVIDE